MHHNLLIPTPDPCARACSCQDCKFDATFTPEEFEAAVTSLAQTFKSYIDFRSHHEGLSNTLETHHFKAAIEHGASAIFGCTYSLASRSLLVDHQNPQALVAWQTNVH